MNSSVNSTLALIPMELLTETVGVGLVKVHESTGARASLAAGTAVCIFPGSVLLWFVVWYTKDTR